MKPALWRPVLGVAAAIAVTSFLDAAGLSAYSALPLFPLLVLFAFLEKLPPRAMGFVRGGAESYGLAALYPIVVLGALAAIAAAAGAIDTSQTDWRKAWLNFALIAAATTLVAVLTEEGFFRGWLFASLERAGETPARVLLASSVAFSLWHVSAVVLRTEFAPPAAQVPVFLVNAAVVGLIWGLMRRISGSVLVSSLSHGVWNGGAYAFFGFGAKVGALGIRKTALFGPEVGLLGLGLNLIVAVLIWSRWRRSSRISSSRAA